jgi:hypothetical protein
MLKRDEARLLLESTTRARSLFGCRDSHCCPRKVQDMLDKPGPTLSLSANGRRGGLGTDARVRYVPTLSGVTATEMGSARRN